MLWAVAGLSAPWVVTALGASDQVAPYAVSYLRWSLPGVPAMLVVLASTGVLRGLQDTRTPLVVAVAGAVANVVLNYLLVYPVGLGIAGSGLGTSIAQIGMAVALARVVVRAARAHGAPLRPDRAGIVSAARGGVPLVVRSVAMRAVLLVLAAAAAVQGDAQLAGHQVVFTIWIFTSFVLDALAIAGQALTGRFLGAGDTEGARSATRRMVQWGLGFGVVVGVLMLLRGALGRPAVQPRPRGAGRDRGRAGAGRADPAGLGVRLRPRRRADRRRRRPLPRRGVGRHRRRLRPAGRARALGRTRWHRRAGLALGRLHRRLDGRARRDARSCASAPASGSSPAPPAERAPDEVARHDGPMRYVIIGAGAVGGTIGGRLHQAGHEVVLVARGEHLAALQRDGLRLVTPGSDETLAVPAVAGPDDVELGGDDVLVLATKSQHTADALGTWSPREVVRGENAGRAAGEVLPVLCAQNGVGNEPAALRWFARVAGVCVWLPASMPEPGTVLAPCAPLTGMLHVGAYPPSAPGTGTTWLTTRWTSSPPTWRARGSGRPGRRT